MQLKSSLISFNHHFDSPVIPTEKEKRNVFTQRLSALFMLYPNHLFKHQGNYLAI